MDLPANADPGQCAQLVDDRCGPTTFPDERERVFIVRGSHGLWRREVFSLLDMNSVTRSLFCSCARSSKASKDPPIQGSDPTAMTRMREFTVDGL